MSSDEYIIKGARRSDVEIYVVEPAIELGEDALKDAVDFGTLLKQGLVLGCWDARNKFYESMNKDSGEALKTAVKIAIITPVPFPFGTATGLVYLTAWGAYFALRRVGKEKIKKGDGAREVEESKLVKELE